MTIEDLIPVAPADDLLARSFGANAYAVGGRIRDAAIGHSHGREVAAHKDLDYVITGHTVEQVYGILSAAAIHVDTVGAAFSVLKVKVGDDTVDVSIARRERSTGPGHRDFEVISGPDVTIEEDLGRRDFTINALALNLRDRTMISPVGALDDVRNGVIRAIGRNTFEDDPLRLLRAAQFASRLGFRIERETFRQMREKARLIRHCSPERVRDELVKMIGKSDRPSIGIEILRSTGLLAHVLPELLEGIGVIQNRHHEFDVWDHLMSSLDHSAAAEHDLATRMAVLMHDIGKPRTAAPRSDGDGNTFHGHDREGAAMTQVILRRLRFPDKFTEDVVRAVRQHMYDISEIGGGELSDATLRRFIRRVGVDNIQRQFDVRYADALGHGVGNDDISDNIVFQGRVRDILDTNPVVSARNLLIRGNDVIAVLIEEGAFPADYRGDRTVSVIVERLLEAVIEAPFRNQRDILMERCREMAREMLDRKDETESVPCSR
jgi:putative nucleotidyltransferase with HDIG domain